MGRVIQVITKKINASSLTEVIVATTILLVVFAIALITLNTIMMSSVQKNTQAMETELEKLIYQYKHNSFKIPNSYTKDDFEIEVNRVIQNKVECIDFSIINLNSKKTRSKRIIAIKNEKY
jgi:hypothetical protein